MSAIPAAILGPGNIGADLMYKVRRSETLELALMSGVNADSEGLALANKLGIRTSLDGADAIAEDESIRIVFDATSARAHRKHVQKLVDAGKIVIDLTPAAVGPYVVPCVNLDEHLDKPVVNMVSCGGQATIPFVNAIHRVAKVRYAEIVATISSKSAGPGTRQNIDEFTETTAKGLEIIGGAARGKAIIILNPADPPIIMRDTIYTLVDDPDDDAIRESVHDALAEVQTYVPGCTLKVEPYADGDRVTMVLEIEGRGDYLPRYSGNLDIMTAAACAVGERIAAAMATSRA